MTEMSIRPGARFAIVGPPADSAHMYEIIDWYRARGGGSSKRFSSKKTLLKLLEWMPPFIGARFDGLTGMRREPVTGMHVICPILPEMAETMGRGEEFRKHLVKRVAESCRLAAEEGAQVVALGAYSSIVVVGHEEEIARYAGIPVTSGNTLTARLTITGVERAAASLGVDLASARVAMLGASGDIGRGVCRWLAPRVRALTLTARNRERLESFAETLATEGAEITCLTDNHVAVRDADIVIAAAISSTPIIDAEDVRPGTIVCDVGFPKNVSIALDDRKDVFAFLGGMSKPPFILEFGYDVKLPSDAVLFGCLSEAIVLSMEGLLENYSTGRGNITGEKMDRIWELALKHGFDVAPFHGARRFLNEDDRTRVAAAIAQRK